MSNERFDELYENRMQELHDVKDRLAMLRSLQRHPGWGWFVNLLEAQVHDRNENFALTTVSGIDELVGREFPRGEMAGLLLALEVVEVEVAALSATETGLQEDVDKMTIIVEEEEKNNG